jgi:hypothetical protein
MLEAPNKLPNKIGLGDYAMGILASIIFSAVVCAVVVYIFHAWEPGIRSMFREGSEQLSLIASQPLIGLNFLYALLYVPIGFTGLLIGVASFPAVCVWLSIWSIYIFKPNGRFLRITLLLISISSVIF